jgi:SAM-dependent MidA family methyltransferase
METCLYDSEHGYYSARRTRWGKAGDYRTSPEQSELFSATFARYFAALYKDLGEPRSWTILEAGAGAGDFARGGIGRLQRNRSTVAPRYVIDETSADSRHLASDRISDLTNQIQFVALTDIVPIEAGIVFANELIDAFPVNRVTMTDQKLREWYVGLNAYGEFEWQLGNLSTLLLNEYFEHQRIQLAEGHVAEVALGVRDWLELVSRKLTRGYLVLVDYGAKAEELYQSPLRRHGTLRSFRNHKLTDDPFDGPGQQDLTSTVNWTFITEVTKELGFTVKTFERQDRFLREAGILEELELQTSSARDEAERVSQRTAAREMILPSGMAGNFQVLVLEKR